MSFGMCEEEDIGLEWNGILSVYIYICIKTRQTRIVLQASRLLYGQQLYIKVKTSTWQMSNRMFVVNNAEWQMDCLNCI